MSRSLRDDIEQIYRAAVERADAGNAVRTVLACRDERAVVVDDHTFPITDHGVYLIGIGKAAVSMVAAAEDVLGGSFAAGLVVTKHANATVGLRSQVLEGAHPVPDERSLAAGEALLQFARSIPRGALVLCLISGGGSALVEAVNEEVTLTELQRVTETLLKAGSSIQELNAVRSRLSRIKAGGLLAALSHTRVVNLIVSDVLGDDLGAIASGPTVPRSARDNAVEVLRRYGVITQLPAVALPNPADDPPTVVCSNIRIAVDAAAVKARQLGYEPVVLATSVNGMAREVGRFVGTALRDAIAADTVVRSGSCLLLGGETVVQVTGDGLGGRNTEAALAAAIQLRGIPRVMAGFLATDGDDGTTGAAGAIVDEQTVASNRIRDADESLRRNDSYSFLVETGAVFAPGPTGTNVNDLVIGVVV